MHQESLTVELRDCKIMETQMTVSQIVLMALLVLGGLISAVGNIMLIVAAFKEGIAWGLCVALFPLVGLIFIVMHWGSAKKAFQIQMLGTSFILLAVGVAVATGVRDASAWVDSREEAMVENYSEDGAETSASASGDGWRQLMAHSEPKTDSSPASSVLAPPAARSSADGEYAGMTLEQVRGLRGDPKGVLEADGRTIWLYDRLEIISSDGVNVTGESRK